jgi:hypothetical protein
MFRKSKSMNLSTNLLFLTCICLCKSASIQHQRKLQEKIFQLCSTQKSLLEDGTLNPGKIKSLENTALEMNFKLEDCKNVTSSDGMEVSRGYSETELGKDGIFIKSLEQRTYPTNFHLLYSFEE